MSKVRKLAEKLLQAEQPPINPYCPYGQRRSCLDDLWPRDQERYIKMAEAALGLEDDLGGYHNARS